MCRSLVNKTVCRSAEGAESSSGNRALDYVAERMTRQNMALLNTRCFLRWYGDQRIDKRLQPATRGAGEPDCKQTQPARTQSALNDTGRISRGAYRHCYVAGPGEGFELA